MFRRRPQNQQVQPSIPVTYLATGTELQGTLHVEGGLRVDGIIHGTVEVRGDLEVSETGLIEGPEIRAGNIIVHGVVKARIRAEGKLSLRSTARLEGDVEASALDIEAGAYYVGYIETKEAKALPVGRQIPELIGHNESSF